MTGGCSAVLPEDGADGSLRRHWHGPRDELGAHPCCRERPRQVGPAGRARNSRGATGQHRGHGARGSGKGILRASKDTLARHGAAIDAFMRPSGFLPRPADYAGQLVPLWTGRQRGRTAAVHIDAVLLGAVLNCTDPSNPRLQIPDAAREKRSYGPRWARCRPARWADDPGRASCRYAPALLAGFAAGIGTRIRRIRDALFGPDGLAALWLEGRGDRPGLSAKIDRAGFPTCGRP